MATDEEIRAKDVIPKLTKFREGDGIYGDGQTSFFMEHQDLANNVIEDSANNTVATEEDLVAGSKLPIMTANGPKSLPGNTIAPKSGQTALMTYAQNVAHSIAPEYNGTTGAVAGKFYMHEGSLHLCKTDTSGDWDASKFTAVKVGDELYKLYALQSRFTTNDGLNAIVKELYIDSADVSVVEPQNITKCRVYNGYATGGGDIYYGASFYDSSNNLKLSLFSSTNSPLQKYRSSYGVFDLSSVPSGTYKDFFTPVLSLTAICQQIEFSPYIAEHISSLRLESRDVVFTDNDTANSYIKELYIDPADVSEEVLANVAMVRIYNGYAGSRHGITLCDAGGNVLFSLYNTTSDSALQIVSKSGVVLDYRTLGSNTYREYTANLIGRNVRNIELSPTIKYSITCEQFTRFTTNDELNAYIKELYITDIVSDATLQSVAYAQIQNGYSGLYGIVFRDANNVTIDGLEFRRTAGTVNEVRHNNSNYNDSMAVLDYRGLAGNTLKTFPCSLIIRNVRNLSASPYINSYYNESYRHKYYDSSLAVPSLSPLNQGRPVIYEADTKSSSNYVVNACAYPDGSFIVCRSGGVVAKIATDGTETTLMTISGATDWRLCWMDKDLNVYVSPHGSVSPGNLSVSDRGLYKLAYGESQFEKVISLYNPSSSITTETQNNDDTIWTMCQDNNGYLYAGVYAHSVRANPAIYKSTDGGDTWEYVYNFATSGLASSGKHIHDIIFNEYDNTLYVMVGEVNQIFFSADGASSFSSARIVLEQDKGTVMLPVKNGLVCGSDGGYKCIISKAYFNFKSSPTFQRYEVKSVCTIWANVVFALRKSDVTGNIYAFTRIDSSVNVSAYYPPVAAISDPSELAAWKATNPTYLAQWESYNAYAQDKFPDDAIRPQHFAILSSEDDGDTWKLLKVFNTSSNPRGFITCGQFRNGELVCGIVGDPSGYIVKPVVISEGKHKYGASGLDLEGEIFVKLNSSSVVTQL